MFAIESVTVLLFMVILVSNCQRRIIDGSEVSVDRKYVVYLVKAPISDLGYDNWLCGGAIVSSEFVITSAACVNDVDYLYIIAGYRKYVRDAEIESDSCTSKMKKKVIYTCSPKGYDLKYGEIDYWSYIDIALVKVESPFDFNDITYERECSYIPTSIPINYEEKYQEPGTDALVLGWGHTNTWRKPGDTNNYNQEYLRYAPTLLLNKTKCMERYKDYKNMSRVIKTYMICSLGKGNIDDAGNTILQSPFQSGCTSTQEKVLGFEGVSCEERSTEDQSYEDDDATRRQGKSKGKTKSKTTSKTQSKTRSTTKNKNKMRILSRSGVNKTRARRSGICQNDHGGPIVTWAGANEILIGVASVFKVSEDFQCMGPYLYTSTLCTGLFLDCILNSDFPKTKRSERRYLCDRPASERGYDTIERTISWRKHPAGPAENENIDRSGAEPKMAPGLKYLNSQPPQSSYGEDARNQEGMRSPSNTMFQADENPAIASSAHRERFKIQERNQEISSSVQETVPLNGTIGYSKNVKYSVHRYPANQRHPSIRSKLTNNLQVPTMLAVRPQHPLRN